MTADALRGRPISPASIAARAVWVPLPSTVSGAQPTDTGRLGRVEDRSGLREGRGERLLPVHMLGLPDRTQRDLRVCGRDREVQDGLHLGVGEQRRDREARAPGSSAATATARASSRSATAATVTAG